MAECDIIHNNNDNNDDDDCMWVLWGEFVVVENAMENSKNPRMDFIMLSIIVSMLFHLSMGELVNSTNLTYYFHVYRTSNFSQFSIVLFSYRKLQTANNMEKFGCKTEDFSTKKRILSRNFRSFDCSTCGNIQSYSLQLKLNQRISNHEREREIQTEN